VHCNALQCIVVCSRACQMLHLCCGCVAACCSVLQCVAVCRDVLWCVAEGCRVLQSAADCCNALQCVAMRCNALQCVAMRRVTTMNRLLKIVSLSRKRALKERLHPAKETYNSKEPTNRSHPIIRVLEYVTYSPLHSTCPFSVVIPSVLFQS